MGCSLCAAACPATASASWLPRNTPDHRVSGGERYAAVYEINLSRCIFCGYCELACPFDAITMGNDFELADYTRSDLIFTKRCSSPSRWSAPRCARRASSPMTEVLFFWRHSSRSRAPSALSR